MSAATTTDIKNPCLASFGARAGRRVALCRRNIPGSDFFPRTVDLPPDGEDIINGDHFTVVISVVFQVFGGSRSEISIATGINTS